MTNGFCDLERMGKQDTHSHASIVAGIAHALSSVEHPGAGIHHGLELLRFLVPSERCSLYWSPPEKESRFFSFPTMESADEADLRGRLQQLSWLVSRGEEWQVHGATLLRAAGPHVAVPLSGPTGPEGILLVERLSDDEAYDETALSWLTVVAALFTSRLGVLRLLEREARIRGELDQKIRFQERLVGIVGHDLRNPLMVIMMMATALQRRVKHERDLEVVRRLVSNTERATRIVGDLQDLTRGRAGIRIPIKPQRVDLSDLLRTATMDIREIHGRDRTVNVRCAPFSIPCDPDRISQVAANLLQNALQYSPPGTDVTITMRGDEQSVAFEVQNWGPIIPADVLPHVFEPWRRSVGADWRQNQGLGLGLYIVREIVRAHHGTVSVRSSEREGTVFTVELPREHPPDPWRS